MVTGRVNRLPQQAQNPTQQREKATANAAVAGSQTSVDFADLPATPTIGQRAFINDSTTAVFYDVAAGGGALPVPVFWDSTQWLVG